MKKKPAQPIAMRRFVKALAHALRQPEHRLEPVVRGSIQMAAMQFRGGGDRHSQLRATMTFAEGVAKDMGANGPGTLPARVAVQRARELADWCRVQIEGP